MIKRKTPLLAFALALSLILSGCAIKQSTQMIDENADQADEISRQINDENKKLNNDPVTVENTPWVSHKPLPVAVHQGLPAELDCSVSYAPAKSVTVFEFAQDVTELCGIPVHVSKDAINHLLGDSKTTNNIEDLMDRINPDGNNRGRRANAEDSIWNLNASSVADGFSSLSSMGMISGVSWDNRELSGLLDLVASRLGLFWKYDNGKIKLKHLDTRVYRLAAIATNISMSSSVNANSQLTGETGGGDDDSSGEASVGGGANQKTDVKIDADVVSDVMDSIDSMLSSEGKAHYAAGSIVVTDTPEKIALVGEYLEDMNARLSRMVRVKISLMVVTLDNDENFGIDWSAVYNDIGGKVGGELATNATSGSGLLSGSFGILDTAGTNWDGTQLMFDALSKQGSVSVATTPTVNTLNMQPAPLQLAEQQYFLKSASTTNTDMGSETSLELGTITSGFNATILPSIIDSNNLLLQFSASIAPRAELRTITSGNNKVEAPDASSRTFSQQVALKSGQTAILTGYEQVIREAGKSGVGSPGFMGLGGNSKASYKKEVIVILVTPVISDSLPVN